MVQRLQFDVLKPAIGAVVLQANVTFARVIFVSNVELVSGTVGALVGLSPFVQIDTCHRFVIKYHGDQIPIASDLNMIPLSHGFHRVLGRFHEVVDGSGVMKTCARSRVVDGDLNSVEPYVLPWSWL